jgi:MFS family permease
MAGMDRYRSHDGGVAAGRRELAAGWPAILACFVTAILGWGFGFYGQAVYLAELQRSRFWSGSLISSGTTLYYLVGAGLIALAPGAIARFGPRLVIILGGGIMVGSALGIALAAAPWQLYLADLAMAVGWAATSGAAAWRSASLSTAPAPPALPWRRPWSI